MDDELNKFVDESVTAWINENKKNLQSMYESYIAESNESVMTFDEFAVYIFYEYGH